jgi:hypothetical protein
MKEKSPYPEIDKLRSKFDANKPLTLKEVCFVLWADKCICSAQYLMFAYWLKLNKFPTKIKMKWRMWYGLFNSFAEHDYSSMSNDIDLVVKVSRLGTKGL